MNNIGRVYLIFYPPTQDSMLDIWLIFALGLTGKGGTPHNSPNLLSTLMSSDDWKIHKKPTVSTSTMIKTMTKTVNCNEKWRREVLSM